MAYTTIDDPSVYFQTVLWSGDNSDSRNITNDGNSDLQPDWVWIKSRSTAGNGFSHNLYDTSRGVSSSINTALFADVSDSEGGGDTVTTTAQLGGVSAMLSDGFTVKEGNTDDARYVNKTGNTYVAWQWKCNGGTTTSFTESGNNPGGTIQTNTTAGFSIITTTGTGATGTIAHGLGAVPHWWLSKQRSNAENWAVYHVSNTSAPETEILSLNTTDGTADNANAYNDTAPTSTNLTVHTKNEVNTDARTYVHYVFIPIQGYSKFGSYTGNANADGPFVYTGFKPAWVLIRNTEDGEGWMLHDTKVDDATATGNPVERRFQVNENQAEVGTTNAFDFLSNGFKVRTDTTSHNGSGHNIIYMAFAEHPFVSSKGVPTTAR